MANDEDKEMRKELGKGGLPFKIIRFCPWVHLIGF